MLIPSMPPKNVPFAAELDMLIVEFVKFVEDRGMYSLHSLQEHALFVMVLEIRVRELAGHVEEAAGLFSKRQKHQVFP
jgi:hypothetical protein